jgi:uncharacterized protein (UPF0248 family)
MHRVRDAMARTAREVLNELRWRETDRLADATIFYRDRARAEGFRIILGSEILDLGRRYFSTRSAGRLPYYRIDRILVRGNVVFERTGSPDT